MDETGLCIKMVWELILKDSTMFTTTSKIEVIFLIDLVLSNHRVLSQANPPAPLVGATRLRRILV